MRQEESRQEYLRGFLVKMENLLINLRNQEDIAQERISDVVVETEGDFFSNPEIKHKSFRLSDGFFCFSKKDINEIYQRLNQQPNLFGFYFDVTVGYGGIFLDNLYLNINKKPN